MNPCITFKYAAFSPAQNHFFSDFNWTIHQGENWIITEVIGSGKTSLVQAIARKYYFCEGSLRYPFLELNSGRFFSV